MINRVLIRIKVLQIVYSLYHNDNRDLQKAEKELLESIQKSYDLYHYFFLLLIETTKLYRRMVDAKKDKFMPTEEDLNPNTRLANNRFIAQLEENEALRRYVKDRTLSCEDDEEIVKRIMNLVLDSDLYDVYANGTDDTYDADKEFWRAAFKNLICRDDEIEDSLEDKCIYWNDDIGIVETFVLKTIKQFKEENGKEQSLLPMFREAADKDFAIKLFHQTLLKGEEYRERINKHMANWDMERIADMDLIIMQIALAEIMSFPSIPVNVTLNEYIDAAKYYSTPKSGMFINGVLDSVVSELKKEKALFKD